MAGQKCLRRKGYVTVVSVRVPIQRNSPYRQTVRRYIYEKKARTSSFTNPPVKMTPPGAPLLGPVTPTGSRIGYWMCGCCLYGILKLL